MNGIRDAGGRCGSRNVGDLAAEDSSAAPALGSPEETRDGDESGLNEGLKKARVANERNGESMEFPIVASANDPLSNDTILWRHMDLYKYMDFLQTAELHFAGAEQMEDTWEGVLPPSGHSDRQAHFGAGWQAVKPYFEAAEEYVRTHLYLNCWCQGRDESLAMWRLYSAQGKGIAIKTTKERLLGAMERERTIVSAPVRYVNYQTYQIDNRNLSSPYLLKRRSFEFECEYRLLAYATETEVSRPPSFVRVRVDLMTLVEEVWVSPDTDPWAVAVVEKLTRPHLPRVKVVQSRLLSPPDER